MAEVLDVEAVLRRVLVWLIERQVRLLDVQCTHIEVYGRWLEEQGGARATVGRRLSTLARFFRVLRTGTRSWPGCPACPRPAPEQDYESRTLALDRNELGAFLVAAGLSSNRDHIFGVVAGVKWAADSEALGSDIEHLNAERGHRTQRVARDGGKQLTIPLAPRTTRAIDLPSGERATPAAHIVHSQQQGRRSEPAVGRVRVINRIVH